MGTHPSDQGDTVVSTRYPLRQAVAMLSDTRRHVSFEVGAMISMELCEREIEGNHLDPDRIWINVIGHLIVSKRKTPRGGLDQALAILEDALHPAARAAFRQTLEAAVHGEHRADDLRERFANFLYPIDRASARSTLARCLDQASKQLHRQSRQSSRPPRSEERPADLLGAGPDSIEVVLSGLDDSVFQQMPRDVSIQLELGPQPTDEAPQRLGRFQIFGEIARGGMAQVLLARDPDNGGKICVVKRMLPGLSLQRSFRNMFTDEARLGLCLDHPHICRTLEFLSVADEPCIKMEWAPGITLSDLLARAKQDRAPISVGFVLRLGEAVASALSYAHDTTGPDGKPLRVVHRDVSPQNVIVQYDGSIKLLDFGVARSAVQTTHSVVGSVKGKFAYMSPEQSLGMPIDERSDVFCVGICLFEALSGRPLFDREDRLAIVRALARGDVPSIKERRHDVPEHVAGLLARCLSSEIEARPTMAELVELLQEAQLRVEMRPDEVRATVRALDPHWEDWRAKLNPFVRDLPSDPSQQGPTRPWQAVTEVAADAVLEKAVADAKRRTDPTVPLKSSKSVDIEPSIEISTSGVMELGPEPSRKGPITPLRMVMLALVVAAVVLGVWFASRHAPSTSAEPETVTATGSGSESESESESEAEAEAESDADADAEAEAGAEAEAEGDSEGDSDAEAASGADTEVETGGAGIEAEGGNDAVGESGTLLIQTEPPGARVMLDGNIMPGRTPRRYTEVPNGSHRVLVRMRGYKTELRWILMRGRNILLRVELEAREETSMTESMEPEAAQEAAMDPASMETMDASPMEAETMEATMEATMEPPAAMSEQPSAP